jgi:tetratricopeptide (TPR) repeat protein
VLIILSFTLGFQSCVDLKGTQVTEDTSEPPGISAESEAVVSQPEPEQEELPPPPDLYAGIREAMEAGNAELAITEFEKVSAQLPDDIGTKILYTSLLVAVGKTEEGRMKLVEILEEQPGNIDALYNLSLVEGMEGHYEDQISLLNKIISKIPDDPRLYAEMGGIYLNNDQVDPAKEAFESSLILDPGNEAALLGYGRAMLRAGKPEESIVYFDKVIDQNSDSSVAYIDRSRAKVEIQDYFGAEQDLTTAIKMGSDLYWNYIDRGRIRLLVLDNVSGALSDFDRAVELDGDFFYAYIYRAGILDRLDRRQEAIDDYLRILESRHDYYYVYAPLAALLYMEARWKEARRYFRKAYDFDKIEYGYPLMVALAYKKEGLEKESEQYLRSVVESIPPDTLAYQMARLFLEPGYDAYMTGSLSRETDLFLKYKMLFYLGSYYLLNGSVTLAQKYLLEVEDQAGQDLFERRLAMWELERFR